VNDHTAITIGCDLGDKTSELCILHADGRLDRPKPVRTTREEMQAFFRQQPRSHVVMEVGAHSRWVSELVERLGHRVTVANPRRIQLITASDRKNDRNDAELLARLGRADETLLSPVIHRGSAVQADLAVAKARDQLVRTRTSLVNHVRGTCKSFGVRLGRCSPESFSRVMPAHLPPQLKPALKPMLDALKGVDEQITVLDSTLEELAKRYPEVEAVSQPSGVGLLTALVFLLTLEDKRRFEKSRDVGAFVGLVARQGQSGESEKQLRITKAGDPFLRRLLVIAANHILRSSTPDSDLKRWGLELAKRGGKNAKKRAKVAVARKLAVLMHRLWVTGEVYEPLGYGRTVEDKVA
jgi:transposase